MLGNQIFSHFEKIGWDTWGTLRSNKIDADAKKISAGKRFLGLDVRNYGSVEKIIEDLRPHAVINCAGVIKQHPSVSNAVATIEVNSMFPHSLSEICQRQGARLVHFSTDCVFSGNRGQYTESDVPDSTDLYGRSKLLGELSYGHTFTIRTSIIGRELLGNKSLVDWFIAQEGRVVQGYANARFSGLTTIELARVVQKILETGNKEFGVWHIAGRPIDKLSLLKMVKKYFNLRVDIVENWDFRCDRTLRADRFEEQFKYSPPPWDAMVQELAQIKSIN
jgi:dTDP-4-dehydrorhamnose reductase